MVNLIIILYYCCCLGYAFFSIQKKLENGFIKAIIITFFPFLGCILVYYLFHAKQSKQYTVEAAEGDERKEEIAESLQILKLVDIENDLNFIPIQDALLLNDSKTKRKLLIHSLKDNLIQNSNVLKNALENEDTETSHYAAAAIMEMKRKLLNSIQELSVKLEEKPNDMMIMSTYAKFIKKYLGSGFLDIGTYQRYQTLYSSVLEMIMESHKGKQEHFIDKINYELECLNYEKALYYSEMFLEELPFDEMAYMMAMKIQYALHNPIGLQKVISDLGKQPFHLSANSLSIVRYWM